MGETNPLMSNKGMIIKQDAQVAEWFIQTFCCCLPCFEYDNKYYVAGIPADQKALRGKSDDAGWKPSQEEMNNLPHLLLGLENSAGCSKCLLTLLGCGGFRGFELPYNHPTGGAEAFRLTKDCTLGGRFCCPHTVDVFVGGQQAGRVVEDWNCGNYPAGCINAICCCRVPYNLQALENGEYVDKYQINVNFCACGPHCNFCGATPCCNDMLWDVNRVHDGQVDESEPAGYIQKTHGGCALEACARSMCCGADNFIVEWPEKATAEDRALFMAAATLLEYVYFEGSTPQP